MNRASQVTFRRNWKSRSKLYPIPYKDGLGPAVKNLSLTGEHAWIRKAHEKLYPCKLPVNSIRLRDNKPHPLFLHNSCTPQYLLTDCKQGLSQLPFPFLLPPPPPPQVSAQLDSTIAHTTYLPQIGAENFVAFYAVIGQLSYVGYQSES